MTRFFLVLALSSCAAQPRVLAHDDPSNPDAPAGLMPLTGAPPADAGAQTATAERACPMHPDVHGPQGSKCPKCGMALTVPVP